MINKPLLLRSRMAAVAAGVCGYCKSSTDDEFSFDVVPPKSLCDIGCDHGKLAVWLYENTDIATIVAADKNELPLAKAEKLAMQRGCSIITRLSDGLQNIRSDEAQLVTISGMSGITMVEILSNCDWLFTATKRLVLLPACKSAVIEQWMHDSGIVYTRHPVVQGKKQYTLLLGEIYG